MKCKSLLVAVAMALTTASLARADDGFANAQLRRTVDPSDRSATGTVGFRVNSLNQTVTVNIKGLGETDFGIFIAGNPTPDTNFPVYAIAPLDRQSEKAGTWSRKFTSNNGSAPLEFPFESLHDLSGGILVIAKADSKLFEQGVTNIVNGVTNVVVGIPLPLLDTTNKVGGVLWAPIPPIIPNQADFSHSAKLKASPATNPPASPNSSANVKVKFNAVTGQSVLDIRAKNLLRGQTYTVYVGDSTNQPPAVLIPAGEMEPSTSGAQQRFLRDTALGDPLPQQARDVIDLSGHRLDIRDNFGNIHFSLIIP